MIKRLSGLKIIDETGGEDVSGEFDLDEPAEFLPVPPEIKREVVEDAADEGYHNVGKSGGEEERIDPLRANAFMCIHCHSNIVDGPSESCDSCKWVNGV